MTTWDLPPDASIKDRLFAALAVPLTVDEIEEATGLPRTKIQNHLCIYKKSGEIACDRDGRYVRLDPTWTPASTRRAKAAPTPAAPAPEKPKSDDDIIKDLMGPVPEGVMDVLQAIAKRGVALMDTPAPTDAAPPSIPADAPSADPVPRKLAGSMPGAMQVMLFPCGAISADDKATLLAQGVVAVETNDPAAVTTLWPHATNTRGIDGHDLLVAAIEALASDTVGMTGARVRFMEGLLARVKGAGNAGA